MLHLSPPGCVRLLVCKRRTEGVMFQLFGRIGAFGLRCNGERAGTVSEFAPND
jgi:hypothetical protein